MKVIAYHAIFSAYGFWLPNDPRGSWSDEVWAKHLQRFGDSTKTDSRRSVAGRPHDGDVRREAKLALHHPAVLFNGLQARAIGRGFADIVPKLCLEVLACAIMPDHTHLVLGRHNETVEAQVGFLKRAASRELNREKLHPSAEGHACWARGGWKRFLFTDLDIEGAVDYVRKNPLKCGLKAQNWSFVRSPG
jgi:REP element-mobilizing transposase RayT